MKSKISGVNIKVPEMSAWCFLPNNTILITGGETKKGTVNSTMSYEFEQNRFEQGPEMEVSRQ
jgi:hypothetical protein